ncbi:MAG: hypothetical protein AAF310_03140 [Myxococcota bacterium]
MPCCLLLAATAVLCCCVQGLKNGVYHGKQTQYRLAAPPKSWKAIRARQANLAWLNTDGSLLMTNSLCKRSDAPLQALANHLLMGMRDVRVVRKHLMQLSDRQALQLHVDAQLDGVARSLLMLVLKKDGCVYDIVLATAPQNVAKHQQTYNNMVASFDVASRLEALKEQALQ